MQSPKQLILSFGHTEINCFQKVQNCLLNREVNITCVHILNSNLEHSKKKKKLARLDVVFRPILTFLEDSVAIVYGLKGL